jgi:hypothetical protein
MAAKAQVKDQAAKGGVLGLVMYFLTKNDVDPALIALLLPVLGSALAWLSTQVGDKELASFFSVKSK